jgi:hypothetical protein
VDVQTRDGRSRNHPGYLWQYGTPGGATIFEFRIGRGREGPMRFLEHFAGILQTEAYAAYDRVGGPKMVHAACWAHSRRRFVEATKPNQQDVVSTRIAVQMAKLLAIDAQAREQNMDHATRHALRIEPAPAVLAELKSQIEAGSRTTLPSSPPGKAAAYTLRRSGCSPRQIDMDIRLNLAEVAHHMDHSVEVAFKMATRSYEVRVAGPVKLELVDVAFANYVEQTSRKCS